VGTEFAYQGHRHAPVVAEDRPVVEPMHRCDNAMAAVRVTFELAYGPAPGIGC